MDRKSNSRFSSELIQIATSFEKALKGKTATEIRAAARKVNTTKQFEEFKRRYSKAEFLIAYAVKVAETIECANAVKMFDIEYKKDLMSEIISNPSIGLNKAYVSFNPNKQLCLTCGTEVVDEADEVLANWFEKDGKKFHVDDGGEFVSNKLVCAVCKRSSAEIIDEEDYYEKDGEKFHKKDDGILVCKNFNSWVIDHIQFPTKSVNKDADKRAQFREYACPYCKRFVTEATSDEEEELICKPCSEEQNTSVVFLKKDALRSKKSFFNTEISLLSQPIGSSDDENLTLNNLLFDRDNSEELILRSRLKEIILKIKEEIASWKPTKTGIFKDPKQEAEMFDYFVPSEFLYDEQDINKMSEEEFDKKIKQPNKATGLIIAEKSGHTFPYAICLDCGLKIALGKKWRSKIAILQKQGCPHSHIASEHKSSWNDGGAYDQYRAIHEPTFQYRIGYKNERGLSAGSNNGKVVEFTSKGISPEAKNYDERRIAGLNIELRSYTNGFSDVGNSANIPLPEGYMGQKERITQYMHQIANRWMGKLRKDCPKCHTKIDQLECIIGQGKMTCPNPTCNHSWNLREGDFLKRIKKSKKAKALYQTFRTILFELLVLRGSNTNIISIGKVGI